MKECHAFILDFDLKAELSYCLSTCVVNTELTSQLGLAGITKGNKLLLPTGLC